MDSIMSGDDFRRMPWRAPIIAGRADLPGTVDGDSARMQHRHLPGIAVMDGLNFFPFDAST